MDEMVKTKDDFKENARVEQCCCDNRDGVEDKDVEKRID